MSMIRCVVFDADHTLYVPHADRAYDELFTFLADRTGHAPETVKDLWDDELDRVEGSSDPDERFRKHLLARVADNLGADDPNGLADAAYDRFYETVVADLETRDVGAVVHELEQGGVDHIVVATNEFPDAVERKLAAVVEDTAVFDLVVTPRDTGTMKPSERFFQPVIDRFDLAPDEVVVVGDSWENDLIPAQRLGMHTVLIGSDTGEPDARIERLDEVPRVVQQL